METKRLPILTWHNGRWQLMDCEGNKTRSTEIPDNLPLPRFSIGQKIKFIHEYGNWYSGTITEITLYPAEAWWDSGKEYKKQFSIMAQTIGHIRFIVDRGDDTIKPDTDKE